MGYVKTFNEFINENIEYEYIDESLKTKIASFIIALSIISPLGVKSQTILKDEPLRSNIENIDINVTKIQEDIDTIIQNILTSKTSFSNAIKLASNSNDRGILFISSNMWSKFYDDIIKCEKIDNRYLILKQYCCGDGFRKVFSNTDKDYIDVVNKGEYICKSVLCNIISNTDFNRDANIDQFIIHSLNTYGDYSNMDNIISALNKIDVKINKSSINHVTHTATIDKIDSTYIQDGYDNSMKTSNGIFSYKCSDVKEFQDFLESNTPKYFLYHKSPLGDPAYDKNVDWEFSQIFGWIRSKEKQNQLTIIIAKEEDNSYLVTFNTHFNPYKNTKQNPEDNYDRLIYEYSSGSYNIKTYQKGNTMTTITRDGNKTEKSVSIFYN